MKKKFANEMSDELRSEYDLRALLKGGICGKYAERYRAGINLVLLDPGNEARARVQVKREKAKIASDRWMEGGREPSL